MSLVNRLYVIMVDGVDAVGAVACFMLATVQELRMGRPTVAWEMVRAVG
jgi:hypothetical protein